VEQCAIHGIRAEQAATKALLAKLAPYADSPAVHRRTVKHFEQLQYDAIVKCENEQPVNEQMLICIHGSFAGFTKVIQEVYAKVK